jgi:hypothetical protein
VMSECHTRFMTVLPDSDELWTNLVRKFSGPKLFLVFLLTLLVLVPFLAQGIALISSGEIARQLQSFELPNSESTTLREVNVLLLLIGYYSNHEALGFFGLGEYGWILSLVLLANSAVRAWFTYLIYQYHRVERFTGKSPMIVDEGLYNPCVSSNRYFLVWVSTVLSILAIFALASGAIHITSFFQARTIVPA